MGNNEIRFDKPAMMGKIPPPRGGPMMKKPGEAVRGQADPILMDNGRRFQFVWWWPWALYCTRTQGSLRMIYRWIARIGPLEIRRWGAMDGWGTRRAHRYDREHNAPRGYGERLMEAEEMGFFDD